MSALKDLINQIESTELRGRVQKEVDRLLRQKKFGIVFEDHLPESVQLPEAPIRRGSRVALRTASPSDAMIVASIDGDCATCFHLMKKEEVKVDLADLVAVAQFGEPIYPYLKVIDKVKNAPDADVWHALIEADNYHALQLLAYLFPRKVTCIYIDPPYNTGARDWKYNNDYVDSADQYRHSKWLSMMKRRLELAKLLLDPNESVLIVTIDEKEYLHLGCLLEEMFPNARMQMVTSIISAKGVVRNGQFSRIEEYIFIIDFGNAKVIPNEYNMLDSSIKKEADRGLEWLGFRRRAPQAKRHTRPNQFYPIFVNTKTGLINSIGDVIAHEIDRHTIVAPSDCIALWPLSKDGDERLWSLIPEQARINWNKGYLRVNWNKKNQTGTVYYLAEGTINDIETGVAKTIGFNDDGSINAVYNEVGQTPPKRVWNVETHNAETYGSNILTSIIGNRFSFPKSLYAVHDVIRFYIDDKPDAIIVDFFAGSGTTLHAVNLLNAEDGGHRHCIMVTNNEVSEDEAKALTAQGYKPGDEEWERLGIARYVTWPRTRCSILGVDVNGKSIEGNYMLTGYEEKEISRSVKQIAIDTQSIFADKKFKKQMVSLFNGEIPQSAVTDDTLYLVGDDWDYAVLFDTDAADDFMDELSENQSASQIFIFTADGKTFRTIKTRIADDVPPLVKKEPRTRPMSEGFAANAIYFKLGFLDKNAVALGRQFRELLPLLWMKCGAHGECPVLDDDDIPNVMVLPENRFAILNQESAFMQLEQTLTESTAVETVFIVTDSEPAFRRMQAMLPQVHCIQLYRDYLDNFRINFAK